MTEILNNKAQHRFELAVEGHVAAAYYEQAWRAEIPLFAMPPCAIWIGREFASGNSRASMT